MKVFKKTALLLTVIVLAVVLSIGVIAGVAQAAEGNATLGEVYSGVQVTTDGKVNLKVFYSDLGSATGFKVEVVDPDTGKTDKVMNNVVAEASGDKYVVKVPLTPSQMTHTVKVTATADDEASTAMEFSVAEYAQEVLATEAFAEYHDAMRMLLNWGAMAQNFFGDATETLANVNVFARGTNPMGVVGADSVGFPEREYDDEAFKKVNLELSHGNIVMNFIVKLDAGLSEDAVQAFYDRDGLDDWTEVDVKKLDDEGNYKVSIANISVRNWDKCYSVDVVVNEEDEYVQSYSVAEYLHALVAGESYTAEQKNVARSMYQFYQAANGNTGAATCAHGKRDTLYWIADGAESASVKCAMCHTELGHQAINNGVNDYIPGSLLQFGSKTGSADVTVMSEDGVQFVRVDNMWANRDNWGDIGITNALSSDTVTGQYMVIKYRVGAEGNASTYIEGFANTNLSSKKDLQGEGEFAIVHGAKGEWVTAVIDLAARAKDPSVAFLPAEDGSYDVQYFSLRLFPYAAQAVTDDSAAGRYVYTYGYNKSVTVDGEGKETVTYAKYETYNGTKLTDEELAAKVAEHPDYELVKIGKQRVSADAYVDVAYVALADSMADIKTLIDTKTYAKSVANDKNEVYNTADDSCVHTCDSETVEGNVYSYNCSQCGEVIYSKTIPESVSLYFSPKNLHTQQNSNSVEQKTTYDTLYLGDMIGFYADADNAYIRLNGQDSVAQWIWNRGPGVNGYTDGNDQDYTVNVGKATHLVIKMKVTNTSETWGLQLSSAGVDAHSGHNLPTADMTSGEWTTVVIDLAKVFTTQYAANTDGDYIIDTFYFHIPTFSDANNVDFAYFAFVEGGLSEVVKVVDTETALLQTTINGAATEINGETGKCVDGCTTSVQVVDGVYKTVCTTCGTVVRDHGVKADAVNGYWSAEYLYTCLTKTGTSESKWSSITGQYHQKEFLTEDGETFIRIGDAETNHADKGPWVGWFIGSSDGKNGVPGAGRYMVMKVRQNNNSVNVGYLPMWIVSSASRSGMAEPTWVAGSVSVALPEDNNWHTIVVDLATRSADYKPTADTGVYDLATFHIRPFGGGSAVDNCTDEVMDLAYIAFFNDLNDLKNIVTEDTYEWSKTSTNSAVYDVETHKCAGAHDYAETVSGTTHTIACVDCGLVANTFEVPADINYYTDRSIMTHYGSTVTKNLYDEEAKIFYNKFYAAGGCHFDLTGGSEGTAGSWTTEKYNSGKYVVIKYRSTVNENMNVGTKDKGTRPDKNPLRTSVGTLTASANWKVQVFEIPDDCASYTVNSEQELYFMVGNNAGTFDIAYLAVVDNVTEATLLLGEGETYYDKNGVEYDKNGTPVVAE